MKITIEPETPADEEWVRGRARRTHRTLSAVENNISEACKEWVQANPAKPGPGSLLRWNHMDNPAHPEVALRIVRSDGGLMNLNGVICSRTDWSIGSGRGQYTVLHEAAT